EAAFAKFQSMYLQWGGWLVFAGGLTPIPYKVMTIASGTVGLNILTFIVASVCGRASRFFAVAALLYFFGPNIKTFIEKYFSLVTIAFTVLLVGGFLAIGLMGT